MVNKRKLNQCYYHHSCSSHYEYVISSHALSLYFTYQYRPISELLKEYLLDEGVLARDLKQNEFVWKDKTVVEMGSGLGVVSAALVHLGANVICTDGEQSVVYQLQDNLDRNFKGASMESECTEEEMEELPEEICSPMVSTSHSNDEIQVPRKENIGGYDCVKHWWGSDIRAIEKSWLLTSDDSDGNVEEAATVDIIIAADVVYGDNEEVWDSLKHSIESICNIGKGKVKKPSTSVESMGSCSSGSSNEGECESKDGKKTLLLLAQTARYPKFEKKFYQNLENSGFLQIFKRCISRNGANILDCSYASDACSEWEWENDFDSCDDESINIRHQLFGYLCPVSL